MLRLAESVYPGGTHPQELGVRHGEDDRVVGVGLGFVFERRDVVFVFGFGNIDPRVVNIDLRMVAGQFAHDVDYLGIAQVGALPALADQAKNSGESLRAGLKPGYLQVYKAWQHFLKVGQEAGVAKTAKRGGRISSSRSDTLGSQQAVLL